MRMPTPLQKVFWMIATTGYLGWWLIFCSHIIRGWNTMPENVRFNEVCLLLIFGILWVRLLKPAYFFPMVGGMIVLMEISNVAR